MSDFRFDVLIMSKCNILGFIYNEYVIKVNSWLCHFYSECCDVKRIPVLTYSVMSGITFFNILDLFQLFLNPHNIAFYAELH